MSRLQKLVSMLGSEQPAEAEAARRKLLEHLGTHRLSLTDVAMRLRDGSGSRAKVGPSFLQGTREMSLERQLTIARTAKQEAEVELRRAEMRLSEMQQALQMAAFDVGRALRGQARARVLAGLGWAAASVAGFMVLLVTSKVPLSWMGQPRSVQHGALALHAEQPDLGLNLMRLSPGEHYGTVLVQDLPIRLNPSDDAGVRAFLNRGMRVVIEQQVRVGMQNWLMIRSVTGSGWVRGADVLH